MPFNLRFVGQNNNTFISQVVGSQETVVLGVNLSNTLLDMPAMNANDVVGNITVVTRPPGQAPNTPVTLGGANAVSFAITNSGNIPCQLVVNSSGINAGSYSISLSAN